MLTPLEKDIRQNLKHNVAVNYSAERYAQEVEEVNNKCECPRLQDVGFSSWVKNRHKRFLSGHGLEKEPEECWAAVQVGKRLWRRGCG